MRHRPGRPYTHSRAGALVMLALLAAPVGVAAQQPLSAVEIEANRVSRENALADSLDERARAMYSVSRWHLDAARLHRRAGMLRGNDPRAVSSFRSAAWMYSAAGEHSVGRQMMETAAQRAAAVGDVEGAANAYIDAAYFAIASDRPDRVPAILGRMHAVLGSPLLPSDRRTAILRRVGDSPAIAALDTTRRTTP